MDRTSNKKVNNINLTASPSCKEKVVTKTRNRLLAVFCENQTKGNLWRSGLIDTRALRTIAGEDLNIFLGLRVSR